MPYYYAEPTGALLQHSNKAFKFKQRLDLKRYTFLRTRGFSIVIWHSLPTKASFQKVYFITHPWVQHSNKAFTSNKGFISKGILFYAPVGSA